MKYNVLVPAVGDVLVRNGRVDSTEMYFVVGVRKSTFNKKETMVVDYVPQRIVTQKLTTSVEILSSHGYYVVGTLTTKGVERVKKHLSVDIMNEFVSTNYFTPLSDHAILNPTMCLVEEKVLRLLRDNGIELPDEVEEQLLDTLATTPMELVDIMEGIEKARDDAEEE